MKKSPYLLFLLFPLYSIAQSVRITSGAHVVLTANVALTLTNMSLRNDGSLTSGSSASVYLAGGNPVTITGTGTTSFSNLVLVRNGGNSGNVSLNQNIVVQGNLGMNSGNLDLNSHIITLGPFGQILNEGDQSHLLDNNSGGRIRATRTVFANIPVNPGNVGAELTIFGSPGTSMGVFTIDRLYEINTIGEQESVIRGYNIASTTGSLPSGSTYRLRYFFRPEDLNGNDPGSLRLWAFDDPSGDFIELGADSSTSGWVQQDNITRLGQMTLAPDITGILPGGNSVHRDGQATSAGLRDSTATNSIRVFPNPTNGIFTLQLTRTSPGKASFDLYDAAGHLLQQRQIDCATGNNTFTWDLGAYASGIYYLLIDRRSIKIIRK